MKLIPNTKPGKWRLAVLLSIVLAIFVYAYIPALYHYARYRPAKGDFIFQSLPHIDLVDAIEGVSTSRYSHVGLVIDKDGAWYVREAISEVRDTPLYMWILRGRNRNFDVYQLKPEFKKNIDTMIAASKKYLGHPYDFRYRLDDEFIYCSELLYKAYYDATGVRMGTLTKLGQMNWQPYRATIEKYERGPVPLDRDMITPVDLSRARELQWVYGNY
jgi:hypothetical protein